MNHQEHFQRLTLLLRTERDRVQRLAECLEQERHALTSRDSDRLEDCTRAKHALLQELEEHGRERTALARRAGHGNDAADMHAYIEWADLDGSLTATWRAMLDELRDCQHRNRVNGGAIELSRQQLQATLGLLRGQQGGMSSTYQANGRTASALGNRSLGAA